MLKRNLFILFTITIFAFASLILDLFNYNPYEASESVLLNFYLSFFLSVSGIASFCIYYLKYAAHSDKIIFSTFWPSVRQGAFVGLVITLLLFLKGYGLLDWWVGISLTIAILLSELFFQTKKTKLASQRSKY